MSVNHMHTQCLRGYKRALDPGNGVTDSWGSPSQGYWGPSWSSPEELLAAEPSLQLHFIFTVRHHGYLGYRGPSGLTLSDLASSLLTLSSAPVRSISTVDLTEKSSVIIPPPDYLECLSMGATSDKRADAAKIPSTSTFKAPVPRPDATSTSPVSAGGAGSVDGVRASGFLLHAHILSPALSPLCFLVSLM